MVSRSLRLLLFLCLLGTLIQGVAQAEPQRVVRVGAFNFYPAIFQDTDGQVKGFYVDALNELAEQENLRIEYVYGSWATGLQRIQSGEVDVLTSVAYTDERSRFLDYSKTPLLTVWGELYVPLASEIDNISKMQGKTVAVMKNDFNGRRFIELAKKFGIRCRFVELPDFESVFQAVAEKRVDAGVTNNTFGVPKQRQYQLRSTGIVFNPFDIYFAVAKDQNSELLALFDSYLQRWRHEEGSVYLRARQRWDHGNLDRVQVIPRWLLILLGVLGLTALLATAFIMLLRIQVAQATEAIAEREAHLLESKELKRLLLDSTAEGLLGLDLDGTCTFCNTACLKILGYEREEQIIGHNAHDLIHHTRKDGKPVSAANCKTNQAIRSAQSFHNDEEIFWRSNGSSFPVEYWGRPILRGDCPIGCMLSFVDISERKQLAESYRFICRSGYQDPVEDFFKALVQHLADSLGFDMVYIGRLNREKSLMQIEACYHKGAVINNFEYKLQDTPCAETLAHSTYCCPQKLRERFPQASLLQKHAAESYVGATLWDFNGRPIGIIAGISRKPLADVQMAESILKLVSLRAAGELERHQAMVRMQQKNHEIERFTYAVSHDLKSPLVTIKTFLGYLQQDMANSSTEKVEKDMGFIGAAAEKMSLLLDELLQMSRVGRHVNPPVAVPFAELVEEALTAVAGAIEKRKVEVQLEDVPVTLHGDRPRLVEIWQNLIDNAVKYMGDQSSPRIEIGMQDAELGPIFYVRDNGIGIDPRHKHKVFGMFEKLDPQSAGTGIGLALVKKIVELYQGSIWLESAGPGPGCCFLFTLPEVFDQQGDIQE